MLISLKKLKEFVSFDLTFEQFDNTLTMLGIEVEGMIDYEQIYSNFFTAKVLNCEKHPKADKLDICSVDCGEVEPLTIVCGDPNVAAGQMVVLGKIGAKVPKGGFVLEKRKIRDVTSFGMICSESDLEMGDGDAGIWVLPEDTPIGFPFARHFGLDDIVIEVALTPNKADCLSHLGIARELAAKLGLKVNLPKLNFNEISDKTSNYIQVEINDPIKCPRYTARVIKNVKIKESPDWLKNHLKLFDIRPINAAVDITNYVLFELGQPLHAFDYDSISNKKIIVRSAQKQEQFRTLDGKDRLLNNYMVVICDDEKPVALGGVMGGENSEISNDTKNILLESAYFDPSTIRKTSKELGLSSDSSYRFERGTDIENVVFALDRAAALIAEICGGELTSGIVDEYPNPIEIREVSLRFDRARKIIGIEIDEQLILTILDRLGFILVDKKSDVAKFKVPHRRNDIFSEIDLIEEIARLYNYGNITPNFISSITFNGDGVHQNLAAPALKNSIRKYLVSKGFTEILTQNMIDPASAELFSNSPVEIANPLGEELSIMRPSVVPSMMKTINFNLRHNNHSLSLFEIGKIFEYSDEKEENFGKLDGFKELEVLLVALVGDSAPKQWSQQSREYDFYDVKGLFESLSEFFNLPLSLSAIGDNQCYSVNSLDILLNEKKIGTIGSISKSILKKFDIDESVYCMEINLTDVYKLKVEKSKYKPVNPFPAMNRDLAFILPEGTQAEDIRKAIVNCGGDLLQSVTLFDVFSGENIEKGKKSLAFNLSFSSRERTLVDEEVEKIIDKVVLFITIEFSAELRGYNNNRFD